MNIKGENMNVSLNELHKVAEYLTEINKCNLSDINWIIDGEDVAPCPTDIERWKYIGLNNIEFAKIHLPIPT